MLDGLRHDDDPGLPLLRAAGGAINAPQPRRREYTMGERLGSLFGAAVIALLVWVALVVLP